MIFPPQAASAIGVVGFLINIIFPNTITLQYKF